MLFPVIMWLPGASNLTDLNGDGLRETYISSSSSTVNIIPSTASVSSSLPLLGRFGPEAMERIKYQPARQDQISMIQVSR